MFDFFSQSDGDCVTLFTLAVAIKESLAGGNVDCPVCVSPFLIQAQDEDSVLLHLEYNKITESYLSVQTQTFFKTSIHALPLISHK